MITEAPFLFSIAALSASLAGLAGLARPMLAFLLVLRSFEGR